MHGRELFHKTKGQRSFGACRLGVVGLLAMAAGGRSMIIRGIPCDLGWWAPSV